MTRRAAVLAGFNAWERRDFTYGDADCCQFVSSMIIHLGGPDYSQGWLYASEEAAYDIIGSYGGLGGLAKRILGEPSGTLLDGDPVLCELPVVGEIMGVLFDKSVVCITAKGMIRVKDKYIIHGWAICHKQSG